MQMSLLCLNALLYVYHIFFLREQTEALHMMFVDSATAPIPLDAFQYLV